VFVIHLGLVMFIYTATVGAASQDVPLAAFNILV
jgi:hypothetical protein